MAEKKTADNNVHMENNRVEAGVLTLRNVSVKEAGRSISMVAQRDRDKLFGPFIDILRLGRLRASKDSSPTIEGYMRQIKISGDPEDIQVTGLTQLYNSFGGNLKNIVAVAKTAKGYADAWRRLITSLEVNSIDIKQQLGRTVEIGVGYSWHSNIFPEILFSPLTVEDFKENYSYEKKDFLRSGQLTMDVSTRIILSDLFFGKEFRLPHVVDEISGESHLTIENYEQATIGDLMALDGVALNGSLLGSNGSVSAATVKKLKSQTTIRDFKLPGGKWPLDRVELISLTYFTLLDRKSAADKGGIDIKRLAKFAAEEMPRCIVGPMFGSFLPSMQGFTKSWTSLSYVSRITGAVNYLLEEGKEKWLSLDNFIMQLLCCPIEGNANYRYLKLFSDEGRHKGHPIRKSDKEMGVEQPRRIDWGAEVGLKFAVNWIKYLCALGMVEIAVDEDKAADDPMDGMRYARLTDLGRYALRIDTDYTPKASAEYADVEFDAQNGILTVDAKSPLQMFLDKVGKRISPTRFRISAETLLDGCQQAADLEKRICNLQTIIDPEKEPGLKKIIEEAKSHTFCASRESGYSLLRLRPDLPGLRELMLTNKELREMTILAGPHLALVKTHQMDKFNAICASKGFLMD